MEYRRLLRSGNISLPVPVTIIFRDPHVNTGLFGPVPLFDVGAIVATAGLATVLAVSIARNTSALARAEPAYSATGMKPAAASGYEA